MKTWWRKRSLKSRLTLWYAVVTCATLLILAILAYGLIEHRLHLELDRELRSEWDHVRSHLRIGSSGQVHWGSEAATAATEAPTGWFEVWSADGKLLLRSWPPSPEQISAELPPPDTTQTFHSFDLSGISLRDMAAPSQIGGRKLIIRAFIDEAGVHGALREIMFGFAFATPIAAVLAGLGGYWMARRTLAPVTEIVEKARQITSESLSERLPNSNPHDEMGQLASVFNDTLQRLEDSFESLRRFTADASHELRTPLTALRTVGEVNLTESNDPRVLRETIGSMLEEADQLNEVIDSLLLLARIENEGTPNIRERVYVRGLLAEVRDSVTILAAEKEQTLQLESDADLVAVGDRVLLRQAVLNILHNAICYSPTGASIAMHGFASGESAVLEIVDNGPGIAPEHQQRVFERFFRVDKSRSRSEGGTGLGLAIAKLTVERLGGRIEVESSLGAGSTFRIVLPREQPNSIGFDRIP